MTFSLSKGFTKLFIMRVSLFFLFLFSSYFFCMVAFVSIVGANREKIDQQFNFVEVWARSFSLPTYFVLYLKFSVVELPFYFFYGAGDFFLEFYDYKTLSWSLILNSSEDFEISVLYTVFCFLLLSIRKIFVGITDA